MAINLDRNLLDELGLGSLPDSEKTSLLNHIYETLEMRVGMRLADLMSNEQLDEFEKYFQAKDDAGAFNWLETNFPNYKEIVQDEFNKLKAEVKQSAPTILAAASQQQPPVQPGTELNQAQALPGQPSPPSPQPYTPPQTSTQPPMSPDQQYPYGGQPPTPSEPTPS